MKVPYTNNTTTAQYIGPLLIQPGDTRMVDDSFLPKEPTAATPAEPTDPVLALLDANVATVTSSIAALSDADLDRLETAEQNGKTRKGVLEAIAAQKIDRAAAKSS